MPREIPEEITELYKFLLEKQILKDLNDMLFQLGFDPDKFLSSSVEERLRALVMECHSQERVPELLQVFRTIRPAVGITQSIVAYAAAIERHTREEWLRLKGFEIDPFLPTTPGTIRADDDPLFKNTDEYTFVVYPTDMDDLFCAPPYSGVRFVFAPAGGGKSSLRRQLCRRYENDLAQWYPEKEGPPLLLPVEYISHTYRAAERGETYHLRRIGRLLNDAADSKIKPYAGQVTDNALRLDVDGPPDKLVEQLVACPNDWKLNGICFFVDNLNRGTGKWAEEWAAIEPLAVRATALAANDGISFRFFFPIEFLPFARAALPNVPAHELTWGEAQLQDMLDRRLLHCENRDQPIIPGMPAAGTAFTNLFEEPSLADRVRKELVSFGYSQGAPDHMWRLGHALLDEHFRLLDDRRQPIGARIRYEVVDKALDTLAELEMNARPPSALPAPDDRLSLMLDAMERLIVAIDGLTAAIRGSSGPAQP